MANQMIALQARAPQSSGIGGAIQQNAQMINMLAQQNTAQRQAALAQQELAAAQRKEARDVSAAEIDLAGKQIDYHYKRATAVNTPQGYQAWLAGVAKDSPEFAEFFVTNLPPEAFDRSALIRMVGSVKDNFDATYAPAATENIIGESGQVGVLSRGGFGAPTIKVPKTYTQGGVGGPMEPAPMGVGGNDMAGVASVLSNVNNDAEYQTVLNAINLQNPQMAASIRQAMPRFDPQRMAGIRNEAKTAFGGAGTPDQPGLVAGERGVGGPDEGYVEAATPFRARVPAPPVGPQPRETAEEVYQKEKARLRAQTEAGPKPLTAPQEAKLRSNIAKDYKSARSTIEMMDGVSRAVNDVRNLSRDQKEAITGLSGYTYSILPSSRSADTKLKNLQGKVTEMGKAAASLTGAIGQMAVQEWRIVSDMIASLDVTGMEPADLDNQLDIIEGQAKRAASITRDAYENQYVEDFARYPNRFQLPEANAPSPQRASNAGGKYPVLTPDQVRKAPKGTTFRTTDGRLMRKN